jgi:hypothetical protein
MGIVAIYCPRTGREVPTGLETDRDGFHRLKPVVTRMKCPACGSEHVWSKATARLIEPVIAQTAPPPRPPPAPLRARPAPAPQAAVPPPPAQSPAAKRGRTLSIASRFLDRQ